MCYLKCTLQSILNGRPDYSGIEYYLDSLQPPPQIKSREILFRRGGGYTQAK